MKKFEFSENNSGGSWWLDRAQYQALFDAGWCLAEGWDEYDKDKSFADPSKPWLGGEGDDVPYGWRYGLYLVAESYNEASHSWERATGQSLDEEGCNCCGRPFYLREAYER